MRYKNYVRKISDALAKFKTDVDTLEGLYKLEHEKVQAKAEEMRGKWTDAYINQYVADNNPDNNFKARLQNARASVEPIVLHYLEMIQKTLDDYFNAPIRPDFANKIMTIKLSGLQLSDLEFNILKDSVTSYLECRLLNQLAESRTKKGEAVYMDNNGQPHRKETDISNPYYIEVPNIEETYNGFKNYKQSARGLLYNYSGQNAKMSHLLDNDVPNYISISMDSYFRNKKEEEFTKVMEKANSILPEAKVKRELTENDKKVIDLIIDEKYPTLASTKVREVAEAMPELRELFLLDERYAKYVEE